MHPTVEAGRVLSGRYRLESRLGEGGMGQIWRAEHLVLGAPVAVKIIERDISRDEEALARFSREAQSAAALRSPHVVQILDYGVDESLPYIVMELLEGETLAERLKRMKRMSPAETARILTHIARAVSRAHEADIVHRDLKPENVFLVQNEDAEIAKVLDFGVAKVSAATLGPKGERTRTGSLLGTPFYMSPEQAQGNREVDYRTDLWALAVIAYECVTGKRPFESDGLGDLVLSICIRPIPVPSEVGPVPVGFDEWFAKATQREPQERFQSARELAEALREVLLDDAREVQVTVPEGDEEWGALPALGSGPAVPTVRVDAATIEAAPPASTLAEALQTHDRRDGAPVAPYDLPEDAKSTGSRLGVVVAVASAFLALGVIAGVALFAGGEDEAADDSTDAAAEGAPRTPRGVVRRDTPTSYQAPPKGSGDAKTERDGRAPAPALSAPVDAAQPPSDASVDGLSPEGERAAAVMKGENPDATAPPPSAEPPQPAPPASSP